MRLDGEYNQLLSYLNTDPEIVTDNNLKDKVAIEIGHEVELKVKYSNGLEEQLKVTIGTQIDAKYLFSVKDEKWSHGDEMLVSDETTVAKALLGKTINDPVIYEAAGQKVNATILGIRVSPLVTGN